MIIKYRTKETQLICEDIKYASKALGGNKKVVVELATLITRLKHIPHLIYFQQSPALKKYKIHELIGKEKGQISLRLNYSYRLTLMAQKITVGDEDDEILILEVSNHYGD